MNIYNETKFIMQKYDVHPNKNLGQNFLFDEVALQTIIQDLTSEDTVLEIGPGLGTLTQMMAEKAKKVIAVEVDHNMVEILEDRFKLYENVEIIHEDVLKLDIDKIAPNCKVIANLPYYITTPIVTALLKTNIQDITILIQKEVADRLCAKPGEKDAGAITYFVNYYADASIKGIVSKECFIPNPKVESAIVNLKKLDKPRVEVKDETLLFKLINENFTKRRKTIMNSLSNCVEKERLAEILKELDISEQARGENLTLEQFAQIADRI